MESCGFPAKELLALRRQLARDSEITTTDRGRTWARTGESIMAIDTLRWNHAESAPGGCECWERARKEAGPFVGTNPPEPPAGILVRKGAE